jgi:threonine aldolase
VERVTEVTKFGRLHSLRLHLDGARLWHASVVTGVEERTYAAPFDTVSVCFSKALGAPMGSCLAGDADFIARARRFKQLLGGGFRQAGIVAAGALHALRNHRTLLGRVHAMAKRFAEGLAAIPGVVLDPESVETNIVRFDLVHCTADELVRAAHAQGVYMLPSGARSVRAAFYLDIADRDVPEALAIVERAMRQLDGNRPSRRTDKSAIQP